MGKLTPQKTERNKRILKLNMDGMSYSKLAIKFKLTAARIGAIVRALKRTIREI